MNSFGKYLTHRLRTNFWLTVVLCLLAVMIMMFSLSIFVGTYYEWIDETHESIEVRHLTIGNFGMVAFILGAACTVIPIVELSEMKSKRNADTIYSIPVDRSKMALAHYVSGLISIFAVFTAAYATMFIKVVTSRVAMNWIKSFPSLVLCYFVLLVVGAAVYSIFMAIFDSANTVVDGCVFIAAWSFLVAALVLAAIEFGNNTDGILALPFLDSINDALCLPHAALNVTDYFYNMIVGRPPNTDYLYAAIFWTVVGIACAAVYFCSFTKKRAEEIGNISDTLFGYKVILPIAIFSVTQAFDESFFGFIFALLIGIVGYMIYRRSFKIKKNDVITIAVITAFTSISTGVL